MMVFRSGEYTGPVRDMSKKYPTENPGRGTYVQMPKKFIPNLQKAKQKMTPKPKPPYWST